MNQRATLIYEIQDLKKTYGNYTALNIRHLQFHRGTIYAVVGPIGSGKSSLLKIMAGHDKPDSGSIRYDSEEFETNWLGKIKPNPGIYLANADALPKGPKVIDIFEAIPGVEKDKIISIYFQNGPWEKLLDRTLNSLSPGERAWLNMVVAVESDPRVLIVDDYGTRFDSTMENEFRSKMKRMNKELGTTIILASPSDHNLKRFASVLIYLDNGHISKIRSGMGRGGGFSKSGNTNQSNEGSNRSSRHRRNTGIRR